MDTLSKLKNHSEDSQSNHRNREMADHTANIDAATLLTIFPNEIWMQIFDNIFQPDEFNILRKSSAFFDKCFETQKTKVLFSEVINVLAAQRDNLPRYKLSAHGKIAKHLLNCRLVCRTWQIGVDIALQSLSHCNKLLDVACHVGGSILQSSRDAHFSLPQQPATFLQMFDREYTTKNRNPFIGRSLYIDLCDHLITDMKSFIQQLLQILAIYGHHIWSFGLDLVFFRKRFDASNAWFYERLRDFLQLMPNLKVLKLSVTGGNSVDNWEALRLSLSSCMFPELKDLADLQLTNLPTPVFDALIRRYSHVYMLSSDTSLGTSDMLLNTHNLPNLTQIAILLRHINPLIQWDTSHALWPLKTLIIDLDIYKLQFDWQQFFQYLESRWAATLTELKIGFHYGHNPIQPNQVLPSLKLPKLKVFAFKTNVLAPLDFILPMKNTLERLAVRYDHDFFKLGPQRDSDFEFEKEVEFFKFCKNLESSNIWSLFPNLNTAEYFNRATCKQLCRRPVSIAYQNKKKKS